MEPKGTCQGSSDPAAHNFVVFSTALAQGWLMLQCVNCGTHATVNDPSQEEWAMAYDAPRKPYRWTDEFRITMHPEKQTSSDYWAQQVDERN